MMKLVQYFSTFFFVILLSSCIPVKDLDSSLFLGRHCDPPCFIEITPNQSTSQDVKEALKKFGYYENCQETEYAEIRNTTIYECKDPRIQINIDETINQVSSISYWPVLPIHLDLLIERFGKPDFITCESVEITPEHPSKQFSLFYTDESMVVITRLFKSETANVKANTIIDYVIFSPEWVIEMSENKKVQPWVGYGEYIPGPL